MNSVTQDALTVSPAGAQRVPASWLVGWLALVSLLHLAGLNGHWWYQPDSGLYMSLARSLVETGRFNFNHRPHTYVWPGFPVLLAGVRLVFGDAIIAYNATMALLAVACVGLAYPLYRLLAEDRRQVIYAMVWFGLSGTLFYYSRRILTETPFTLLVIGGLYCTQRMLQSQGRASYLWALAVGVVACAATFVRPFGPALAAGTLAGLWLRRRSLARWQANLARSALAATPLLGAAALWVSRRAPLSSGPTYGRVFVHRLQPHVLVVRLWAQFSDMLDGLGEALFGMDGDEIGGVILLVPILIGAVRSVRRRQVALVGFAGAYMVGVFLGSPGRRYILPLLPLLIYWAVDGAPALGAWLCRRWKRATPRAMRMAGWAALAMLVGFNLSMVGGQIFIARSPGFVDHYWSGRLRHYAALCDALRDEADAGDAVLVHQHRLVHYWTRLEAWRFSRRWVNASTEGLARGFAARNMRYLVRDMAERGYGRKLDAVMEAFPSAFELAGKFGHLRLYRVRQQELTRLLESTRDAPGARAPGDAPHAAEAN